MHLVTERGQDDISLAVVIRWRREREPREKHLTSSPLEQGSTTYISSRHDGLLVDVFNMNQRGTSTTEHTCTHTFFPYLTIVRCFTADGNSGLNDTSLPSFASYANSTAITVGHGNLTCPAISGENNYDDSGKAGPHVRLRLDASYLGYRHCVCNQGMEVGDIPTRVRGHKKQKQVAKILAGLVREGSLT